MRLKKAKIVICLTENRRNKKEIFRSFMDYPVLTAVPECTDCVFPVMGKV